MLIPAIDAESNNPVTIDTTQCGMPPRGAVALKQPEPGQRARWVMSEKEASRLLWQGADILLLPKSPAGAGLGLQVEEHPIVRSAGMS
jgi:hypothetical protein